jgi:hypothetical protein
MNSTITSGTPSRGGKGTVSLPCSPRPTAPSRSAMAGEGAEKSLAGRQISKPERRSGGGGKSCARSATKDAIRTSRCARDPAARPHRRGGGPDPGGSGAGRTKDPTIARGLASAASSEGWSEAPVRVGARVVTGVLCGPVSATGPPPTEPPGAPAGRNAHERRSEAGPVAPPVVGPAAAASDFASNDSRQARLPGRGRSRVRESRRAGGDRGPSGWRKVQVAVARRSSPLGGAAARAPGSRGPGALPAAAAEHPRPEHAPHRERGRFDSFSALLPQAVEKEGRRAGAGPALPPAAGSAPHRVAPGAARGVAAAAAAVGPPPPRDPRPTKVRVLEDGSSLGAGGSLRSSVLSASVANLLSPVRVRRRQGHPPIPRPPVPAPGAGTAIRSPPFLSAAVGPAAQALPRFPGAAAIWHGGSAGRGPTLIPLGAIVDGRDGGSRVPAFLAGLEKETPAEPERMDANRALSDDATASSNKRKRPGGGPPRTDEIGIGGPPRPPPTATVIERLESVKAMARVCALSDVSSLLGKPRKMWTDDEDAIVLGARWDSGHGFCSAAMKLLPDRTYDAIQGRWRKKLKHVYPSWREARSRAAAGCPPPGAGGPPDPRRESAVARSSPGAGEGGPRSPPVHGAPAAGRGASSGSPSASDPVGLETATGLTVLASGFDGPAEFSGVRGGQEQEASVPMDLDCEDAPSTARIAGAAVDERAGPEPIAVGPSGEPGAATGRLSW